MQFTDLGLVMHLNSFRWNGSSHPSESNEPYDRYNPAGSGTLAISGFLLAERLTALYDSPHPDFLLQCLNITISKETSQIKIHRNASMKYMVFFSVCFSHDMRGICFEIYVWEQGFMVFEFKVFKAQVAYIRINVIILCCFEKKS